MNVAELIDEARDFHEQFTRQRIPDVMCMRELSRSVHALVEQVTAVNEQALAEVVTVTQAEVLAALATGGGIALPEHVRLFRPLLAVVAENGTTVEVDVPDPTSAATQGWRYWPAATVVGGRLYPLDRRTAAGRDALHGWEDFDGLRLSMVRLPAFFTGPNDTVPVPRNFRRMLVLRLALFMAGRTARTVSDMPLLPQMVMHAERSLMETVAAQTAPQMWRIKETRGV